MDRKVGKDFVCFCWYGALFYHKSLQGEHSARTMKNKSEKDKKEHETRALFMRRYTHSALAKCMSWWAKCVERNCVDVTSYLCDDQLTNLQSCLVFDAVLLPVKCCNQHNEMLDNSGVDGLVEFSPPVPYKKHV